jgi:hypothetical protein
MTKSLAFLKKEFFELLPPTIFFLVVFEMVVLVRSLIGNEPNFTLMTNGAAIVGALVVGKSILIADALPFLEWFKKDRLILNVLWRLSLYMSVVIAVQTLEELIPVVSKYGGLTEALSHLSEEVRWRRVLATHLVLAVFLSFYTFSTALIGVVGADRTWEVFFGHKSGSKT